MSRLPAPSSFGLQAFLFSLTGQESLFAKISSLVIRTLQYPYAQLCPGQSLSKLANWLLCSLVCVPVPGAERPYLPLEAPPHAPSNILKNISSLKGNIIFFSLKTIWKAFSSFPLEVFGEGQLISWKHALISQHTLCIVWNSSKVTKADL